MKINSTRFYLAMASALVSMQSWSQCAEITCPSNISAYADAGSCSTVLSYAAPQGFDGCITVSDTVFYTGSIVQYTIPPGVTFVTIEARGAEGGNGNGGSSFPQGQGAIMIGDFNVTPGQVLNVLVGQNNNAGNGGGGGTFVVDAVSGNPLIVAGGGAGASGAVDWSGKHGQITIDGANGGGGGGLGGINGNGGSAGASFASGAGGGFFTNGADGWTAGSGGQAYVNGGAGANVGFGIGGFGGGGNGSGNQVGGGGGGYSGGGSGSNSTGAANGGGGGSINNGTNQNNTAGANTGHGMVILSASAPAPTSLYAGIGSGGTFPVGVNVETYIVTVSPTDTATCSFTVTVFDTIPPAISPVSNVQSCDAVVNGISAVATDACGTPDLDYTLSGATTGSGSGDANGATFNTGVTTVWYYATDASGNMDSTSFDVTVFPAPTVTLAAFPVDSLCIYDAAIALPAGTPAGGTYTGAGVSGSNFDPSVSGLGNQTITYTYVDSNGCQNTATATIFVDGCSSLTELTDAGSLTIYPNPNNGSFTVNFKGTVAAQVNMTILDVQGRILMENSYNDGIIAEEINLNTTSKGIYFVQLTLENKTLTHKIIVE